MSHSALSERSGVSEPTVKRILGGKLGEASFENVRLVAEALGVTLAVLEIEVQEFRSGQARRQAERLVAPVAGVSATDSQSIEALRRSRIVEQTFHTLMADSGRRLWRE